MVLRIVSNRKNRKSESQKARKEAAFIIASGSIIAWVYYDVCIIDPATLVTKYHSVLAPGMKIPCY